MIDDLGDDRVPLEKEADPSRVRTRMTPRVRKRFLDNPIEGQLGRRVEECVDEAELRGHPEDTRLTQRADVGLKGEP